MKKVFATVVLALSACGGGSSSNSTDNCTGLETCCNSLSGTDKTTCQASVTAASNVESSCMQALANYQATGKCGGTAVNPAPVISALTYSPMSITVGQQSAVMVSFTFSDVDGDVKESHMVVTTPKGTTQEVPNSPLSGTAGAKTGTINATLTLTVPDAGKYVFVVTLLDNADHESNALTGTITAQ